MTTTAPRRDVRVEPPAPDLVAAVARQTSDAVRRMVTAFVDEIPFYARLPEELVVTDVAQVCRDNVTAFLRCCRERRMPDSTELLAARAGAARRAEEGVPLDAVLMAYTTGNRITWQVLAEQVPAGREEEIVAFTPYLQCYLQAMVLAVTQAYVEERRAIEHDEGSAWQVLVQQLLTGEDAGPLAQRLGVVLAEAYDVVSLHLEPHCDERDTGLEPDIAARRKLRRVQAAVEGLPGRAASLASLLPSGGVLLLPRDGGVLPHLTETTRTVAVVERAAGAAATAAVVPAPVLADVPAAAAQAAELLRLARALGRPPGVHTLDDLVLEHQMSLSGPARARLADLVRPLLQQPDLLPTVRCWLSKDRSRRETAEELHVHPNTLDKRLERVRLLTGIEIGTTRGVAVLQAGLVALQLDRTRE